MTNGRNVSVPFMCMGILLCTCLIVSNLLETKILQWGRFTMTGGVLCFPLSYILNDCIAEVWGFRKARFVIWIAFLMNFFVVMVGQLAVILPSADYWQENEAHFNFVFGMAPRIAFSSFVAFLAGSFINAYVMSCMKVRSNGRHFSLRAIVSTLWGESVDSLIFFPLAFGGVVPLPDLLWLMCLQVLTKTGYEVVMLPVTCKVVDYVKQKEQTDVMDRHISYNPFSIFDL